MATRTKTSRSYPVEPWNVPRYPQKALTAIILPAPFFRTPVSVFLPLDPFITLLINASTGRALEAQVLSQRLGGSLRILPECTPDSALSSLLHV